VLRPRDVKAVESTVAMLSRVADRSEALASRLVGTARELVAVLAKAQTPARPTNGAAVPVTRPAPVTRPIPAPRPQSNDADAKLPPGELAVLRAAAQFDGVEKEQLSVLTGYKRSSRDAYIQRLRDKGLVAVTGNKVQATPEGVAALGPDFEPLPTGQALQDYWRARLPQGEKAVLEVLVAQWPNAVEKERIDEATGYRRSSRDAYIQRLRARRLVVEEGRGQVKASDLLFN